MAVDFSKHRKRYLLGEILLEPEKRLIIREGEQVRLAKLPFQVLLYLIEHRDRIVSRNELLDHFWDGKYVYDDTLRKCVGTIRKALGDSSETPRFIETRWAEGYRYIGPLEEQLAESEPSEVERTQGVKIVIEEEETQGEAIVEATREESAVEEATAIQASGKTAVLVGGKRSHLAALLAIAIAAMAIAGVALVLYHSRTNSTQSQLPHIRSIAVLPLRNLTGDTANEYLCDGITESLISALSRVEGLKVISRSSVFGFKGKEVDPREVGKKLGVEAVLEGDVQKREENIRVEVRLVSTEDGRILWASDTYDQPLGEIFFIQDEIARGTAKALKIKLNAEGEQRLAKRYTYSAEAYQAYLKGRYFWNQTTPDSQKKAFEYFDQAIEKDPHYALAYAGLADCYATALWVLNLPPKETVAKAKEAAAKALEIDDTLAEAHIALSGAYFGDWDWLNSRREIERAVEFNPGYAEAHHHYAYTLLFMGRADEAITEIKRAWELDPLSITVNTDVGEVLLYARRYDDAIEALKKTLELDPNRFNALWDIGEAYEQKGMYTEAVENYLKSDSSLGDRPEAIAALKEAYTVSGIRGFWQKELGLLKENAKGRYMPPFYIAGAYARLGEKDQAFEWLERAYEEHFPLIIDIKIKPQFDSLRSDPRFRDLLRRIGLQQ